jgi:hypothetical protein
MVAEIVIGIVGVEGYSLEKQNCCRLMLLVEGIGGNKER